MARIIDQVYDYLKSQGLQPDKREYGIAFMYQMMNFVIIDDKEDEYFFRIIMPRVLDVDANNREDVLEACNKLTADLKLVKAFVNDSDGMSVVWLCTEQLLDQDPRFGDIVPRSLKTLLAGHKIFGKIMNA